MVVEIVKTLAVMMDEVAVEPPRLEVKVFTAEERVLGTERSVMVALVAVRLVKKAVMEFNKVEKKFVELEFVVIKFVTVAFAIFVFVKVEDAEIKLFVFVVDALMF